MQSEVDPRAVRRRIDTQTDRGEKRIRFRVEELECLPGADGTLDVDRRRFAERDLDSEVVCERRLDDLLLDVAVERDGDLIAGVVLPDVDQRILLGELRQRHA